MAEPPTYILDIEWDKGNLPPLVGPFETEAEAVQWGNTNIPNGTWQVRPVAWPYARPRRNGGHR